MANENGVHFILVHGLGHGAWCWYKLATLLRSDGHKVTVPDLAASGVDSKGLDQVGSVHSYFQPLMEIMEDLAHDERVILVGHSYGGIGIALAMEKYPQKVWVGVFATAVMPNFSFPPAAIIKEFFGKLDDAMDCQFTFDRGPDQKLPTSMKFGPNFIPSKLYQCCPPEDITLAKTLVRPGRMFEEDISREDMFTVENYGSVHKVYVVCKEDKLLDQHLQEWVAKVDPTDEVIAIEGADHMPMLSKPKEFHRCLLQIAEKYASFHKVSV
ncbi:hypothetical protein ACLOJK_003009 [Asimina triloba]